MDFASEDQILVDPNVAARLIGGKMVLVRSPLSTMYTLNPVGSEIWNCLEDQNQVGKIVEHIVAKFDVSREVGNRDVQEFLEQLVEMDLIRIQKRDE